MKLTIKDRYILLQLLPATGTFSTIRAVDKTRKLLSPSDTEKTTYEVQRFTVVIDGRDVEQIKWNDRGDTEEVEITIPSTGFDLLKEQFQKLDREGKLPAQWAETLEKLDALIQEPK